jgi:hypothetical protein
VKSTKKPIVTVPPLRIQTQGHLELWARTDKDKAELFAAHLSKVFTLNDIQTDYKIEEAITTLPQNILTNKILTPKEVKEEIGFLNLKKAPGIDKITPKMKELPKKGLVTLTYIYNAMIRLTVHSRRRDSVNKASPMSPQLTARSGQSAQLVQCTHCIRMHFNLHLDFGHPYNGTRIT